MRDCAMPIRVFGFGLLASLTLAVGAGARQLPPPPPPPPPSMGAPPPLAEIKKGTGFVLGQVVDAGTNRPVAGAIVSITGMGALPGGVPGGPLAAVPTTSENLRPSAPRRVITDIQGRYLFRELSGGRYGIAVTALGYLSGGYLVNKPGGTQHFLDLGDDERRGDVQIRLWKYASISGTVLDEAGEPAVGASIKALRRLMTGGKLRLLHSSVTTDDRGMYRISGLSPGDYLVGITVSQSTIPAATAETLTDALSAGAAPGSAMLSEFQSSGLPIINAGHRIGDLILNLAASTGYVSPQPGEDGKMLAYATTFFPGVSTSLQAAVVTLRSGEERSGVDLPLRLVPTVRVSGSVVDSAGPARSVGVRLLPLGVDEFAAESGVEVATTGTDAGGAFTFLGVPAGQYTLKVVKVPRPVAVDSFSSAGAPAIVMTMSSGPVGPLPTYPTLWAMLPVTVGTADVNGLSIVLKPGLRISGRVEFVGAKAKPTPEEIVRSTVTVTPLSARPVTSSPPGRITADGLFNTVGYPPGKYLVSASIALPGWTLLSVMQGNRDVVDEPLELDSSDAAGIVITFSDKSSELSGTIVDAKGAPDSLAEVIVFPADSQSWRQNAFGTRRIRLTPGTKAGTYGVPGLPPGQYYVAAVSDNATGDWQDPKFLDRLQPLATRVTIAEGEKRVLALKTVVLR